MPRYYFNIYNDEVTIDEEGAEFAGPGAARDYAIEQARSLAADTVLRGYLIAHHRLEIADERRQVIDAVHFGEAVEMRE